MPLSALNEDSASKSSSHYLLCERMMQTNELQNDTPQIVGVEDSISESVSKMNKQTQLLYNSRKNCKTVALVFSTYILDAASSIEVVKK